MFGNFCADLALPAAEPLLSDSPFCRPRLLMHKFSALLDFRFTKRGIQRVLAAAAELQLFTPVVDESLSAGGRNRSLHCLSLDGLRRLFEILLPKAPKRDTEKRLTMRLMLEVVAANKLNPSTLVSESKQDAAASVPGSDVAHSTASLPVVAVNGELAKQALPHVPAVLVLGETKRAPVASSSPARRSSPAKPSTPLRNGLKPNSSPALAALDSSTAAPPPNAMLNGLAASPAKAGKKKRAKKKGDSSAGNTARHGLLKTENKESLSA